MAVCGQCGAELPERARFCPSCGAAAEAARETRKVVTVLFCDWVGMTALGEALDPESLRRVQETFFAQTRTVLERHSGTVEKYIGDAVMAVFGIPQAHEDDALRAVRSAVELREGLAALNEQLERELGVRLSMRTGVNTGEVVAGDATSGHAFVTGDAVAVAKRLEESATPGEILIGETTHRLVRDAVLVEPLEDVSVKGKTEPVPARRLLGVITGAPAVARRLDSALVDRERELELLRNAFESVTTRDVGQLFTVLGPAGVGKSRLVHELLSEIQPRALVLRGRCLPYGEGITFWPLRDVVHQAARLDRTMTPAVARARVAALFADEDGADAAAEQVALAVGIGDGQASAEETFLAVRKLLVSLARERPLVVVFDDVHWGEPTFLDLLEYIVDWIRDAPVLLVCLARPDLLDLRPSWAGGKLNATSILLEPLTEEDANHLVRNLLGGEAAADLTEAIVRTGEGNPLFVEEILSMLIDEGTLRLEEGAWVAEQLESMRVPPTINALLAARLDRLEPADRAIIEAAAVMGMVFPRQALVELAEAERVDLQLETLGRKELIRPAADDQYGFRHILIQDAAYRAIPKERRASLHEQFADWLEEHHGERVQELEEILGFHLEQAYRTRVELGPEDARAANLASRAAARLTASGRRAIARGDLTGAVRLLSRASDLLRDEDPARHEVAPTLGWTLAELGEYVRAESFLTGAAQKPVVLGDARLAAHVAIVRARVRAILDPANADELERAAEEAVAVFDAASDELGLARAWHSLAWIQFFRCRFQSAMGHYERALEHAERAGEQRLRASILNALASALRHGPTPVQEAIRRAEEILERAADDPTVQALSTATLGHLKARLGHFGEARSLCDQAIARLEELGVARWLAFVRYERAMVEILTGHHADAERRLREVYDEVIDSEDTLLIAETAAGLAQVACLLERYEDADRFSSLAEQAASPHDRSAQIEWRQSRAKVAARSGDPAAESLAGEAVALAEETDALLIHADALMDLGDVLFVGRRSGEATRAVEQALALYTQKGDIVSSGKAEVILARLRVDRQATKA